MIENFLTVISVSAVFLLFSFGLRSQLKDREYDFKQIRTISKKLVLGYNLSISGFVGFLFFYSVQLLIHFGLFNNEVVLNGESAQVFTYISLISLFIGKYLVYKSKSKLPKTILMTPLSLL
ncbi:MAG TPA: hypothetical protein VLQ66_10830 [Paenisporosarcina sp.]|nr:hypothetical protein [Paenisporosarcina sp.]